MVQGGNMWFPLRRGNRIDIVLNEKGYYVTITYVTYKERWMGIGTKGIKCGEDRSREYWERQLELREMSGMS